MCFNQRFGRCFSYGCTACLYIVQFPFTLAGNFAVTLPIVTCLSTVKMYLCVLINVLVAVFLTVAQFVCTLCNFRCRFRHICSNVTVCFGYIYCERFLCALEQFLPSFSAVVGGKVNFCVTHRFFGNTANKSVARGNKVSNFMQPAKIFVKRRIVSVRQRRGTSACDKIRLLVKNKRGFVNLTKGAVRCTIPLQTYRE